MRYLTIFILLIGIVLLKTSCKKNDVSNYEEIYNPKVIESKFFQLNTSITKESKSVYNYLQNLDKQFPFAIETAKKIGYPIWDKVLHKKSKIKNIASRDNLGGGSSGDTLISIIPFIKENDTVINDVLIVKSTDADTLHYFVCDWQYSEYNNTIANDYDPAEKFSFFFLALNKEVFGYDIFTITDSALFSKNGEYAEIIKIKERTGGNNFQEIEECYEVEVVTTVCGYNFLTGTGVSDIKIRREYSCMTISSTYEYCITIPGSGGPTGGGPTGGGGGGPTGGPTTPPECPSNNFNNNCPTGWNTLPNSIVAIRNIYQNANSPLTNDQIVWLNYNRARATELYNYLEEEGATTEAIEIAKQHLDFMIDNQNYLSFVADHKVTGDSTKMWWNDINWLRQINFNFPNDEIFNLYIKAAKPKNEKPIKEFTDKCEGIKYITNLSLQDKKERSGFITLDGKFIYTNAGSLTSTTPLGSLIRKNGQLYYNYKVNKGAPLLNYYGMIVDAQSNEYWIPVRAMVHNHILGHMSNEVPIETDLSKSDGDADVAAAYQKGPDSPFRMFVIEAKENGKFLTASFHKNLRNYNIINNNINFNDICDEIQ